MPVRRIRLAHRARVVVAAAVATMLAVLAVLVAPAPAGASTGSDPFTPGHVYRGEFADPTVLRVGQTFYAYATNTANLYVPVTTSTDLVSWTARGNAFSSPASWAVYQQRDGRRLTSLWAPSVARVGSRYVLAYVVPVNHDQTRHCIALAIASSPLGPFRNVSNAPFVCSSDPGGSIDPQVFVDPRGVPYLIWKNAGTPHERPTMIWSRRLAASGTSWAAGATSHYLLRTAEPWEGTVIENPAMGYYAGRYYLFYSGNYFGSAAYATGYAICNGPLGPCHRPSTRPLLSTTGRIAGPGGATPFVGGRGGLRLAYAAWTAGHVGYPANASCQRSAAGCNQRRLHVAMLAVGSRGLLRVTAY